MVRRLREANHEALWAGGCVRDELLGLTPKDYDVATSARPEEVRKLFRRTIAVGMSFGVVDVIGPRHDHGHLTIEVATFRSDVSYSDGRHPDAVVFSSAREDALRRDFTINGMFYDPLDDRLIDYVGGQDDLRAGVLRAIGDPRQRFDEDKLRMLRAVRMATRFGLAFDPATEAAVKALAGEIRVVSAERIADELRKMLADPRRARGMSLFFELGLAAVVLPELVPMRGLPQGLPPRRPVAAGAGPARSRTRPTLQPATCGNMCCSSSTISVRTLRFPWHLPPCCTTSANRARSAVPRTGIPFTATNTSAGTWRRQSACVSSYRMRNASASNGSSRNIKCWPTPGKCAPAN